MPKFILSVTPFSGNAPVPQTFAGDFGGLWLARGAVSVNGAPVAKGSGALLRAGDLILPVADSDPQWVQFALSKAEPPATLLSAPVDVPTGAVLLRLDQVKFPPGAIAFRHVHPGDGIRFLSVGELQVIGDKHTQTAKAGQAWFEAANSPVRAVASAAHPMTSFVRFMILPVEFEAKPSIRILDAGDAAKPRLQITHRHFDQVVQVASG